MVETKTLLLTGATGFVGANLARKLLAQGHEVHISTRLTSAKQAVLLGGSRSTALNQACKKQSSGSAITCITTSEFFESAFQWFSWNLHCCD